MIYCGFSATEISGKCYLSGKWVGGKWKSPSTKIRNRFTVKSHQFTKFSLAADRHFFDDSTTSCRCGCNSKITVKLHNY